MSSGADALQAYQRLDPEGWVGAHRFIPVWAGLLMVAVGLVLLGFGGGRAFRPVAALWGLLLGLGLGPLLASRLGLPLLPKPAGLAAALALATGGLLSPALGIFLSLGLAAGLIGGELVGTADWALGFIPVFLLVGTAAAVLMPWVAAILSALVGGWLVVLGALSVLEGWKPLAPAPQHPAWTIGIAFLLAAGGAWLQIAVRGAPERARELKRERRIAKQRKAEAQALEERWTHYSARRAVEKEAKDDSMGPTDSPRGWSARLAERLRKFFGRAGPGR